MKTIRPSGWSTIWPSLAAQEKPALIALIDELFDARDTNRELLQARYLVGDGDGELLEKCRHKIAEQFFPARGGGIGWGFHDFVGDVVGALANELGS